MKGKLVNRNDHTAFVDYDKKTIGINSFGETKNDIDSEKLDKDINVLKREKIFFIPLGG
jgi:hypothetical protein